MDLALRLSHFLDVSLSVVGEASIVVQGAGGVWGSADWFGIARTCDYASVALDSAGGCGCKLVVLRACTLWCGGG